MTSTARSTDATLTAARLGEAWPEVSRRLHRLLSSRGVDASLRDDIVQEVAVRALTKQVPFSDPADLYAWAATTARNLHVDHLRSGGRTTGDEVLVAVPDTTDVAHAAERRVALGHVFRALATMRPGERDAILDSLDEDRRARSSQALVRRHRARATLRKAVGGSIAVAATWRLRLRTVSPSLRTVAAAAVLAPVLALEVSGTGGGDAPTRALPALTAPRVAAAAPVASIRTVKPPARRAPAKARPARRAVVAAVPATPRRAPAPASVARSSREQLTVETEEVTVHWTSEPKSDESPILCVEDPIGDRPQLCTVPWPKPRVQPRV